MAGAFCALALFLLASSAAYADEDVGRLHPTSRGGRREPPVASVVATPTPPATPAVATAAPSPTPSIAQSVAGLAQQYVGSPYVFGGASPVTGFDCSGLVQWVLSQIGVPVGHSAAGQYAVGDFVPPDELQPGDLVFYANTYMPGISHVGVYVGNGEFVNAVSERSGVRRTRMADPYWASRYVGARRVK